MIFDEIISDENLKSLNGTYVKEAVDEMHQEIKLENGLTILMKNTKKEAN